MDATTTKVRVLDRIRSEDLPQSQRCDRQTVVPMTREQYDTVWADAAQVRQLLDCLIAENPELVPACLRDGYALHGQGRASVKLGGIRLRKIKSPDGTEAFHLRPSFVMSYMAGTTKEVENALQIGWQSAEFGVPDGLTSARTQ